MATRTGKSSNTNDALAHFGENVFSIKTMRNYLSEKAYKSLTSTICNGDTLDPSIADEVADAMKTWAMERGASHFSHWFQPLTGATAEKHESFIAPDREGGALAQFSGKELIQGEPDASSFPSGGLRATFEARGYTAWDPTSPAFIRSAGDGASVLCIPTVFCGYHGEALDKKTPLLRSMNALNAQLSRVAKLFRLKGADRRGFGTLGPEQEYFLIDREFYEQRPDLLQTGRTLFGQRPARHQQMEDHYFGHIKPRVLSFMGELDAELWRYGIPSRTRHNEVSPAQFEIAPVFEELNLAVDHNMLVMQTLREVADRHGFACLLHEKPFAGVNGSGKHNNWSVCGPDGKNWLTPGSSPHENAKFLLMICAIMKAVDTHASLLRAAVASAGNDHRLGANEAPPAILSIFLGDQLTDVIEQIEKGAAKSSRAGGFIEIGVSSLPRLPRDATDRNRTSPLAFTGNKFEFRAVGSNQSCAGANVVLNTIVAWALDELCSELEAVGKKGAAFNSALQKVLSKTVKKHKRILFNGDNYTAEWHEEAKRRGLPNLRTTPEALKALTTPDAASLFEKYGVLSRRELQSRYDVYMHTYEQTIALETGCAIDMARSMILPAAMDWQALLADTVLTAGRAGVKKLGAQKRALKQCSNLVEQLIGNIEATEAALSTGKADRCLKTMLAMRETVDALEGIVPRDNWPVPTYADMMFLM